MAKIKKLPGLAIINGFKGKLDFYVWMGIPCVRSWPRSPGHDRTPAVETQWPAFAFAGSYWESLSTEVQQAYVSMASGFPVTGRDIFTKSFISGKSIVFR